MYNNNIELENLSFDLNSNNSHNSLNLSKLFPTDNENSYDSDYESPYFIKKDVENNKVKNDKVEKDEKMKNPEDYSGVKTNKKYLFNVKFIGEGKIVKGKKLKKNQNMHKNTIVTSPSSEKSDSPKNNLYENNNNEIKKESNDIIIQINNNIKQSSENNIETKMENNDNKNILDEENNDNINKNENQYNEENYLNKKRKKLKLNYEYKKDSFYKRVRRIVLNILKRFINKKLKSSNITKYKEFRSFDFGNISRAKANVEKEFLNEKLINIFSGVNGKYAKYNKDKNNELIQELMKRDSEYNFKAFFELSFLDCLNHFNGKKLNLLIGIEKSEEEILKEEKKFDEDEMDNYRKFIENYENDINKRKSRNRGKIND